MVMFLHPPCSMSDRWIHNSRADITIKLSIHTKCEGTYPLFYLMLILKKKKNLHTFQIENRQWKATEQHGSYSAAVTERRCTCSAFSLSTEAPHPGAPECTAVVPLPEKKNPTMWTRVLMRHQLWCVKTDGGTVCWKLLAFTHQICLWLWSLWSRKNCGAE